MIYLLQPRRPGRRRGLTAPMDPSMGETRNKQHDVVAYAVASRLKKYGRSASSHPEAQGRRPARSRPGTRDRHVIDVDPAFGEQFFDVAVGQAVAQGTGGPSARCPRVRVLFRRPPARTAHATFAARRSPVTTA